MKRLALVVVVVGCGSSKPVPVAAPPPAVTEPAPVAVAPAPPPLPPEPPKPVGHPRNDLIPRAVLFGNPERTGVEISPDGKYLSWLAPKDGVLNVWVAPIDHLDKAKPVTSDATRPVRLYFWAYDNKHVLYSQDTGGDENWHVFRTDVDGTKAVDITPFAGARADVVAVSERKPGSIAIQVNDRDPKAMDYYELDIASGKRTLIALNDQLYDGFTLDPDYHAVIASKPAADGHTDLFIRSGKDWKPYDTVPFEDVFGTGIGPILPGGKKAYAVDTRGRDTAAFFELDLATKKEKLVAEDPHADAGPVLFHPTKHTAVAIAFDDGKMHWRALDKAVQPDLDGLEKLAEGGNFFAVSGTLDDKTWVVITDAPTHGAHFYLWNRAKHAATFLFSAKPELDKQPLADMKLVTIPARDGLQLPSYLTLPRDAAGKPVPMVLFVHGGPWGRDNWGFDPFAQLFANRGYAVLQVNFRASTGFGKKHVNAGNHEWSKKMHDDLLDAVQWAIAQGITTKDRVAIAGGSYGGYSTLVGLAMTPDVFAAGVDLVGPSNLVTLFATIPPYWAPAMAQFKQRVGDPDTAEGKAALQAASPLTHAANIKSPLLIGQGANDPRVKQAESEQIVAAMKAHGLPVSYVVCPDEGHGFARPENNIAFFALAEAFLSAHLGGSYQPITKAELESSSIQFKEGRDGIPGLP